MPIHLFEEEAFCGLSKLQRLQMRFCEISEMPPLNPVKRTLSRITLTHNRIMSIAADYFFGFANLRYLELSHNCLMSVSQLHPLSATLEHLYLDSNRLQHFPTSVHNVTYTLLLTLSLSGNNLIEFTKDVLGNLQNLGRLNLRTNSISRVEDLRSIHRLGRLTVSDFASWASSQILKIVGCACAGNAGNVFPAITGKWSRHASRHVCDARAVMHAGIAN